MTHRRWQPAGFSLPDLVAALASLALLLAIAWPALGGLRSVSGVNASMNNLAIQSVAHMLYAADWDGRQFTVSRDDFGALANSLQTYMANPANAYVIPLGWAEGSSWIISPTSCGVCFEPIRWGGPGLRFGSFRIYNFPTGFHDYVNGRVYDPVLFAPNDTAPYEFVESAFDDPDELVLIDGPGIWPPSYSLSPAAMFDPDVMRALSAGGWQNPWHLADGFASPPLAGAAYPDLKTHMIEHHWVQDPPAECNPAFNYGYDGCQPYYFNHGIDSTPVALFYDGHVRLFPNTEALAADQQILEQSGGIDGTWSRDTPFGVLGYFIEYGFDGTPLSHHVLTTDGILGRDTVAGAPPPPPMAQDKPSRGRRSSLVAPEPPPMVMVSEGPWSLTPD